MCITHPTTRPLPALSQKLADAMHEQNDVFYLDMVGFKHMKLFAKPADLQLQIKNMHELGAKGRKKTAPPPDWTNRLRVSLSFE